MVMLTVPVMLFWDSPTSSFMLGWLQDPTQVRIVFSNFLIVTYTTFLFIFLGNDILIPRIKFHPKDRKLPVEMERVQFPIRLCFGITANKSQGQTYKRIGINLSNAEMFSHGQLYVALSRVGSAKSVSIFKPKGKYFRWTWFFTLLPPSGNLLCIQIPNL